ncbi:MAG: flagellar basal body FlgE domain-containing protein, partial [Streptosporangiaceae bacterium]
MTVPVFDSQGTEHDLTLNFQRVPAVSAIQTFTLSGSGLTAGHPVQFSVDGQTFTTAPLAGNTTAAVASAINTTLAANSLPNITAAAPTGTTITFTDSSGTVLNGTNSIAEIVPTFSAAAPTQAGVVGPPITPTIDTLTLTAGALATGDTFTFSINGSGPLSTGPLTGTPPTFSSMAAQMQTALNTAGNPDGITIGSGSNTIIFTDPTGKAFTAAPAIADANVPAFSAPANTQSGASNSNLWTASASIAGGVLAPLGANNTIVFNTDGTLNAGTTLSQLTVQSWTSGGAAAGQVLNLNLGTPNQPNGLTQFGSAFAVSEVNQDG